MKQFSLLRRAIALGVILNLLGMPAAMAMSCLCAAPTPEPAQAASPMMDMPGMTGMDPMAMGSMSGMDAPRNGALHGGCQGECPHGKQAMARPDAPRLPAAALVAWAPPPFTLLVPATAQPPHRFHLQRITSPPPSQLHCCLRI